MEWISWHGKWKCMEMCLNVWMKWNGAHGKGLVFVNEAFFLWIKIVPRKGNGGCIYRLRRGPLQFLACAVCMGV